MINNLSLAATRLRRKFLSKLGAPIFIVGCGHSGTSLLLAVLGAHSKIHVIPKETYLAFDLAKQQPGIDHAAPAMLRSFEQETLAAGKFRWVEKTPAHVFSIPELRRLCAPCQIIVIIRDGRDVACSIRDRTGSLEGGIRRWVEANRAGQAFWGQPDVTTVKYEDLITDFEGTMKRLMAFLGEEFEEPMRNYHQTERRFYSDKVEKPPDAKGENHAQFRNWQINQPLFDGRGKWQALTPEERALIKEIAGPMLIEYGYAADQDW